MYTPWHKLGLVTLHNAINIILHLVDPPAAYGVFVRWKWNEFPSIIGFKSLNLLSHGSLPMRELGSLVIELRLKNMTDLQHEGLIGALQLGIG